MTNTPDNVSPVQTVKALLQQLQRDFPVFAEFRPLAIGIDKQLIAQQPQLKSKILRSTLAVHTKSVRYLKELQFATVRFNLDGTQAGAVTDEQRALAATTLHEIFRKRAQEHKAKLAAEAQAQAEAAAIREREAKLNQLVAKFAHK
jgi:ProP effector